MSITKHFFSLTGLMILLSGALSAQTNSDEALASITAAELKNHIFFLASDFLNGRQSLTPEYQIAAEYVASQFAAAGLEPVLEDEDGNPTFFQGVPFARTKYSENFNFNITIDGQKNPLQHHKDFKVMMGNNHNHDKAELVWVGYGINEPNYKWNDLEGLELQGKVAVCLIGAPMKKGKPILPEEVHNKYNSRRGIYTKLFNGLFRTGIVAVILVDPDGSGAIDFNSLTSELSQERFAYKGSSRRGGRGSFPSIYVAQPEALEGILVDSKGKALIPVDKALKGYQTGLLPNTVLTSGIEIEKEDIQPSNNVIGIVRGTDPVLKDEYIVVGAHLDHVRPQQGQVCNGADDNASGSSGVMEIAEAMALNPGKRSVVFITYTAEEMGLIGSRHFIGSDLFPQDQLKFNVNMDMIGRSSPKNEETRAHYVVTNKRYVEELESFIGELNTGVTDFPLIFDNDQDSPGGSDHQSFISEDIPAFFFFSGVHPDLHRPTDDADKIDYAKAEQICKLGYLITNKLANVDQVPSFMVGSK